METLSHTPFIVASYLLAALVLGGLALFTLWRAKAARQQADQLEALYGRRRTRQDVGEERADDT